MLEPLVEATADYPGTRLVRHVIRNEADASRLGMHGSPTLLINGVDPFAAPGTPASLSCRVYRDETGQSRGAPSLAALRMALLKAVGASGDA